MLLKKYIRKINMINIVEKGEAKEFKSFYKVVGGGEGDRCNYRERLDL